MKLKLLIKPLIFLILLSVLNSCHKININDSISNVESMLAEGQYESARSLCNEILSDISGNDEELLPSQLCRLALQYMTIAENSEENKLSESDMTNAINLFNRAKQISEDSVMIFISSEINEQSANVEMLFQLSMASDKKMNDVDIIFEEQDSVFFDINENQ